MTTEPQYYPTKLHDLMLAVQASGQPVTQSLINTTADELGFTQEDSDLAAFHTVALVLERNPDVMETREGGIHSFLDTMRATTLATLADPTALESAHKGLPINTMTMLVYMMAMESSALPRDLELMLHTYIAASMVKGD